MLFAEATKGDEFLRTETDQVVEVTDKTTNSIEVYIRKWTKFGKNGKQWLTDQQFNKEFTTFDKEERKKKKYYYGFNEKYKTKIVDEE